MPVFAEALRRYGVPEEVLTDNGKQFTDRFGKGGWFSGIVALACRGGFWWCEQGGDRFAEESFE